MTAVEGPSGSPRGRVGPAWVTWLLLAGGYFAAAKFEMTMTSSHPSLSSVWSPSGIALAALLLFGPRLWPAIAVGSFLANVTTPPGLPAMALALAAVNTSEALLAAFLIRRFLPSSHGFEHPLFVARFVAIAGLTSLLAAIVATPFLCAEVPARWSEFWPWLGTWWLGDTSGILVVTPMLLAWSEIRRKGFQPPSVSIVILWIVLMASSLAIFSGWLPAGIRRYAQLYLILLPLLWIGLLNRIGMTTAAMAFVMVVALWGTQNGFGPFQGYTKFDTLLELQFFVAACAVTALAVSAFSRERLLNEHRAEHALQRSMAILKALNETTLEGILVVDEHRTVASVNRRFGELWGMPAEVLETRSDQILLNHASAALADPEPFLERVSYLYEHPAESSHDMITLRDGRTLCRYTTPASSAEGRYLGRVWFFWDVTESEKMTETLRARNEQLQQLDRLKDLFLSSISHEMRTPLSLITGYAELMEDKYPGEELIAGILNGSKRLTDHLTKILDYSALLASSMSLYLTEVSVAESASLAQEVITADPDFRMKQLSFELEIAPDTPPVRGDSRRIAQIMLELLENAVKYTPDGGRIGLRIAPMDRCIRIEVWDNGLGISPGDLTHLGQAFTQLELNPLLRTGGLGLGLSIVKKLVELHGGSLEIRSQQGQGTTVVVVLPQDPLAVQ